VRELPSGPGAQNDAPLNEAEYMTATGSSLIKLHKQSCARERSIYVCGELLISVENQRFATHRIVSMSATIRRSAQNSNVYGGYGIMSSDSIGEA